MKLLFVTGNKHKAEYIERLFGLPIDYQKLDVDEIQSTHPGEAIGTSLQTETECS